MTLMILVAGFDQKMEEGFPSQGKNRLQVVHV